MRQGADSSNWTTPARPDSTWDALAAAVDALFPQALTAPAGYPTSYTQEQCQWALDHGKLLVPYIWKWFGTGLSDIQRRLDILAPFAGQIDALALDVEDTTPGPMQGNAMALWTPARARERFLRQPPPDYRDGSRGVRISSVLGDRIAELQAAFALCDSFPTKSGLKTLCYTGGWYWGPYLGGTDVFSQERHLWGALYDGIFDPARWTAFGGWTELAVKQPFGTSDIGGVGSLDPDVLADWFLATEPGGNGDGVDWAWQRKKDLVVNLAGMLGGDLVSQYRGEANRRGGPRRAPINSTTDHLAEIADRIINEEVPA